MTVRCLITGALLVLAVGYAVATLNLYFTYSMMDGSPGLTPEDLKRAFYGRRTVTLLAAKIDGGSMEQFLPDPLDKAKILNWIQEGTPRQTFENEVGPILVNYCWRCHSPGVFMYMRPLQTYEQVLEVTKVDRGESMPVWARVAHTHLQSIALIFFLVGIAFLVATLTNQEPESLFVMGVSGLGKKGVEGLVPPGQPLVLPYAWHRLLLSTAELTSLRLSPLGTFPHGPGRKNLGLTILSS